MPPRGTTPLNPRWTPIRMSDRGRFEFFDEWRLAAALEAVWPVMRDIEAWPDWWPSVRSVTPVTGGSPQTWEFRFRTRLPYDMAFAAELVRDDELQSAEAQVTGRVVGSGLCTATAIDGGTLVRFDWWVRPQLTWMRVLAPMARPVFRWNHRALMAEGAIGLARRLDTHLLADPVGVLLPARQGSPPENHHHDDRYQPGEQDVQQ
jgi:Polyketide cyclase / dehydrase and lipid transport